MDNLSADPINDVEPSPKKFLSPKIIFIILGIIVVVEIVYAIRVLTLSTPTSPPPVSKKSTTVQKTPGKLSLTVSKTSLAVNEVVPVSAIVDTGGHLVNGVDLIVHFDPKVLEITQTGLVKGNIFDEYPLMSVDASKGLIAISGISSSKNGFTGSGQFAVINLKAKIPGTTVLTIDYKGKNNTTDSNLVEMSSSKDILEIVNNLELTVK